MKLEAGKEMDRRCVMNWLIEVCVTPSRAFSEYTDDELKMFAHDALVFLKEQNCNCCGTVFDVAYKAGKADAVVLCTDCKHGEKVNSVYLCGKSRGFGIAHDPSWFCADGERKE